MFNYKLDINDLIRKYISGTLSDSEAKFLADWVDSSKQNTEYFRLMYRSFEKIQSPTIESEIFWKRCQQQHLAKKTKMSRRVIISASIVAPVLLILICVIALSNFVTTSPLATENQQDIVGSNIELSTLSTNTNSTPTSLAIQYSTSTDEHKKITLPDGSVIILNSNSQLTQCEGFNDKDRRVILCGEAYFDIAKSDKKFIVQTNNKNYIVHGTSFNIFDHGDNLYSIVTLHSGKLEALIKDSAYMLAPGEELRVDDNDNSISKHKVDVSNSISWLNRQLKFSRLPLKYVASQISHKYGVKINIHSSIENIIYTGQLKNENLETALNLLSITAPVKIAITEFKGEYYISQRDNN